MAHFARVVNNKVVKVIVAEQEFIDQLEAEEVGEWVQTSYNTRGNVHYGPDGEPDGGVAFRGNYAGAGYFYDPTHDVFYPPSPARGWVLNSDTWLWVAPFPPPDMEHRYRWDEDILNWVLTDSSHQS